METKMRHRAGIQLYFDDAHWMSFFGEKWPGRCNFIKFPPIRRLQAETDMPEGTFWRLIEAIFCENGPAAGNPIGGHRPIESPARAGAEDRLSVFGFELVLLAQRPCFIAASSFSASSRSNCSSVRYSAIASS